MMNEYTLSQLSKQYNEHGFISGISVMDETTAQQHRTKLESAERQHGKLHYMTKIHTLLNSPYELSTLPHVLDIVEQLIGPDILLFNTTYIIKEPQTQSCVSWHQDLTYWGLSHDDQVTMWLALSPADELSGCMKMIPGSHTNGRMHHHLTDDENNVLLQGQTVTDIDETIAVSCALKPGEASFHHGWTLHASAPNCSSDRRIGLNVQFIAPHVRQTKHDLDTAILVRGKDQYGHFGVDKPANTDFDEAAVQHHTVLQQLYKETAGTT